MYKDNNKRIVITGAAGVGKTTTFNDLREELLLKSIPEQARIICKKMGYKNIYEIKEHEKFRNLVLEEQFKLEEQYNSFISDRSTVDCWVHWVRWSWNLKKVEESEKYFLKCFQQAKKYSHIIYIPRLFKSKEDGFRWNNEDYQNQIDRLVLSTIKEWGLVHRTHIVRAKTKNDRLVELINFLKKTNSL